MCFSIYLQEVVLQRPCDDEKLGLTLCYGAVEDGITDIFIGEVSQTIQEIVNIFAFKTKKLKKSSIF